MTFYIIVISQYIHVYETVQMGERKKERERKREKEQTQSVCGNGQSYRVNSIDITHASGSIWDDIDRERDVRG